MRSAVRPRQIEPEQSLDGLLQCEQHRECGDRQQRADRAASPPSTSVTAPMLPATAAAVKLAVAEKHIARPLPAQLNAAHDDDGTTARQGRFAVERFALYFPHPPPSHHQGHPMNGADVVAEILRREGTDFLSAYPRNPLIESCAALNIRPIFCRQERVGVGLADGYSAHQARQEERRVRRAGRSRHRERVPRRGAGLHRERADADDPGRTAAVEALDQADVLRRPTSTVR